MASFNGNENGSGKYDPTAAHAIGHTSKEQVAEEKRFRKLLGTIFNMCDLAGFHLEERIVVRNKKSGKIYK